MGEVVAIAAVGRNGVIGAGNDIPWRIREDWVRFKLLTMGQVLLMGRKTFASIGRPLAGRQTIVITRDPGWSRPGVTTAATVATALAEARRTAPDATVFVAGGGEIYRAAWDVTDRLEITEVDQAPPGDVTFPPIDPAQWHRTGHEQHDGFAFSSYVRAAAGPSRQGS